MSPADAGVGVAEEGAARQMSICIALRRTMLIMSVRDVEAEPDDPALPWTGDNDNARPFAWGDRRPTL